MLCEALDRTYEVIQKWEATKIIPPPLFAPAGEACKRWYSAPQIVNCNRIMFYRYGGRKYFQDKDLFAQFTADLRRIWYADQVVVNEQGEIDE